MNDLIVCALWFSSASEVSRLFNWWSQPKEEWSSLWTAGYESVQERRFNCPEKEIEDQSRGRWCASSPVIIPPLFISLSISFSTWPPVLQHPNTLLCPFDRASLGNKFSFDQFRLICNCSTFNHSHRLRWAALENWKRSWRAEVFGQRVAVCRLRCRKYSAVVCLLSGRFCRVCIYQQNGWRAWQRDGDCFPQALLRGTVSIAYARMHTKEGRDERRVSDFTVATGEVVVGGILAAQRIALCSWHC